MAIVLNPAIPPQVWGVNQQVTIQLGVTSASTPAVTSASALGLPTGLTISNDLKITGKATAPGLYDVQVWGNGSGNASGNITFQIGIDDRGLGVVPAGATEIDIDVRSSAPSVPGVEPGATGAILHAKRGDTLHFAVGFAKEGVLQELDMVALSIGIKRNETDALIAESDGVFYRVGSGAGSRYLITFPLPAASLNATLGEEESDEGTVADYLAEIEAVWNHWPPGADPEDEDAEPEVIRRTCQTFKLRIERDWLTA